MANISSVLVEIDIPLVVEKEFMTYVDLNKESEYPIVEDRYVKREEDDHVYLTGYASGRWSYDNNLKGYFENVKPWLGVGYDFSHLPADKAKSHRAAANKAYRAYTRLCSALKRNNVAVEIHYRETEGGNCFITEGWADFDGKALNLSEENHAYDIASWCQVFGGTIGEAVEDLYGDEILSAFYAENGEDASLLQFEQWYATYEGE